jgi:hypothetical protein
MMVVEPGGHSSPPGRNQEIQPMSRPLPRRGAVAIALAGAALLARGAAAQPAAVAVRMFKAVTARDETTFGMTEAELARLGAGPEVERIARKLVADGQITVWQDAVGRAPDGSTRWAPQRRVAIMRNDTLRIEPYAPALPVVAPPAE